MDATTRCFWVFPFGSDWAVRREGENEFLVCSGGRIGAVVVGRILARRANEPLIALGGDALERRTSLAVADRVARA